MDFNSDKLTQEHKFSFFKKDKKINKALKFKDNLMIGIFLFFVINTGNLSMEKYTTLSEEFQQKVVNSYTPITPVGKQFVSKDSSEILVGYLANKDVSYEDLDKSIEIVKANQKDLPSYILTHTIDKLKSDNLNLYRQYSKQVRDEYFYMMSVGVPRFMLSKDLRISNNNKLNSTVTIYNNNFEKIESKINSLLPLQTKFSEIKDRKNKTF